MSRFFAGSLASGHAFDQDVERRRIARLRRPCARCGPSSPACLYASSAVRISRSAARSSCSFCRGTASSASGSAAESEDPDDRDGDDQLDQREAAHARPRCDVHGRGPSFARAKRRASVTVTLAAPPVWAPGAMTLTGPPPKSIAPAPRCGARGRGRSASTRKRTSAGAADAARCDRALHVERDAALADRRAADRLQHPRVVRDLDAARCAPPRRAGVATLTANSSADDRLRAAPPTAGSRDRRRRRRCAAPRPPRRGTRARRERQPRARRSAASRIGVAPGFASVPEENCAGHRLGPHEVAHDARRDQQDDLGLGALVGVVAEQAPERSAGRRDPATLFAARAVLVADQARPASASRRRAAAAWWRCCACRAGRRSCRRTVAAAR